MYTRSEEAQSVEFGVILGQAPSSADPSAAFDLVRRQVEAAQRNGFTYITIGQHFLYGESSWLQPIPVLARLAADVDADVRLVTSIIVAPLYHPVVLAEELATLDIVTGGRLVAGLGVGYRPSEFENLGVRFDERIPRFEESVELIARLWSDARVDFDGTFWSLKGAEPHIRPIQRPRPPIWIGGKSAAGVRRAARLGDAWMITGSLEWSQVARWRALYRQERRALGHADGPQPLRRDVMVGADRDDALARYAAMARGQYAIYGRRENDTWSGIDLDTGLAAAAASRVVAGTADACIDELRSRAVELGVDPIIVQAQWPGMPHDDVISHLDELGAAVVRPLRAEPVASS